MLFQIHIYIQQFAFMFNDWHFYIHWFTFIFNGWHFYIHWFTFIFNGWHFYIHWFTFIFNCWHFYTQRFIFIFNGWCFRPTNGNLPNLIIWSSNFAQAIKNFFDVAKAKPKMWERNGHWQGDSFHVQNLLNFK